MYCRKQKLHRWVCNRNVESGGNKISNITEEVDPKIEDDSIGRGEGEGRYAKAGWSTSCTIT